MTPSTWLGLHVDTWVAIGAAATAGTFLIAAIAAAVAFSQLREAKATRAETRATRLDQTRPYVVVTFEQGISMFDDIDLLVRNVGAGPARDVHITVNPPLERTRSEQDPTPLAAVRYFNEAVPIMAPGYVLRTFFDDLISRNEAELPMRYTFRVRYHDGHGHEFDEEIVQDLALLEDLLFTQTYNIHHAAKALREIHNLVRKWPMSSSKPTPVVTETLEEHNERHRARMQAAMMRREERMAKRAAAQQAEAARTDPSP